MQSSEVRVYHVPCHSGKLGISGRIMATLIDSPPNPCYYDFLMLYVVTVGLHRGIALYDYASQYHLAQQIFGTAIADVMYPYYVYPPWFAYSTGFLGWLSPEHAARLWFWCSFLLIFGSVFIISQHWSRTRRLIIFFLTLVSPSVISLLIVGQFTTPVLLGVALVVYAAERRSPFWYAVGMLFMTRKPLVGLIPFLFSGLWLVYQGQPWHRLALRNVIVGLLGLAGLTFLIYPTWVGDYLAMLTALRNLPSFGGCTICSSGSILFIELLLGTPNTSIALYLGLGLTAILVLWLWKTKLLTREAQEILFWSMLLSVLTIPYFNNYGHIFSLFSFFWLVSNARNRYEYILLACAFLLTWTGPLSQDRQVYEIGLILPALILFGLMTKCLIQPKQDVLQI